MTASTALHPFCQMKTIDWIVFMSFQLLILGLLSWKILVQKNECWDILNVTVIGSLASCCLSLFLSMMPRYGRDLPWKWKGNEFYMKWIIGYNMTRYVSHFEVSMHHMFLLVRLSFLCSSTWACQFVVCIAYICLHKWYFPWIGAF